MPVAWALSLLPLHCRSTPNPPRISAWDRGQPTRRHSSSLATALGSQQGHSQALGVQLTYAASHKEFTFLTLPGVWGPSTRRLMGVRGVLPYIISVSIWRLFFRCCARDLHLQTRAEERCRAGCTELRSACLGRAGFCQRAMPCRQSMAWPSSRYFNRFTGIQSQAAVLAQLGPRKGLNTCRH